MKVTAKSPGILRIPLGPAPSSSKAEMLRFADYVRLGALVAHLVIDLVAGTHSIELRPVPLPPRRRAARRRGRPLKFPGVLVKLREHLATYPKQSLRQRAQHLGVSPSTLRRYLKRSAATR
jgi:hypothetical protein